MYTSCLQTSARSPRSPPPEETTHNGFRDRLIQRVHHALRCSLGRRHALLGKGKKESKGEMGTKERAVPTVKPKLQVSSRHAAYGGKVGQHHDRHLRGGLGMYVLSGTQDSPQKKSRATEFSLRRSENHQVGRWHHRDEPRHRDRMRDLLLSGGNTEPNYSAGAEGGG